jgi:hypothetical protein
MNAHDDYVKPNIYKPISATDELSTVETEFGSMQKWKARALAIGWFQAVTRNDSADNFDEDKPPPPMGAMGPAAAREDQEAPGSQGEAKRAAAMEEVLAGISASLDRLSARLDDLERKQAEAAQAEAARAKAQQALLDAEELFTAREAPDPNAVIH